MTGIEFLKELNETKSIPTIITTAHSDKDYLLEAIKLKVAGYLIKPINVKDLLDIIYQISLPILQTRELEHYLNIINTISALVGGKKMLVIKYVLDNLDENGILNRSYQDISNELNISKPTVVKVFQDLMGAKILKKIKNRCYQFQKIELFGVN
jgi:response regulator of citrate/malate metabolism